MRVALFTETYLPQINGAVTHIKMLKDGLVSLGHQAIVVAPKAVKKYSLTDDELICPGLPLKKIYNYSLAAPYSKKREDYIRKFKPDVIHIHNEFGMGFSALKMAKKLNIPLVYTLHSEYNKYLFYVAFPGAMQLAEKLSYKYMGYFAKNADVMISPSAKAEEYLKEIGVDREVIVIPNNADVDTFSADHRDMIKRNLLRDQIGTAHSALVFCFVGRIGKEKSLDDLIDFWQQTQVSKEKAELWIIGGGPQLNELKEKVETLGLKDEIRFLGSVEHGKISEYLWAADFYATASLSEMHSVSMLEAMAAGLPVLQRLDEQNLSQIEEGVNGYIYKDASEFKEKIQQILNMPEAEIRAFQQRTAESMKAHGKEELAAKIVEIYQMAIQTKKENSCKICPLKRFFIKK
ncbi:glycosyltransferase family 4 protein [Clostridiales bacterium COT073_COT-073]|nr:glycosyltransferase family 4 protein [Clostridiales bacterium COT073_COT-073]